MKSPHLETDHHLNRSPEETWVVEKKEQQYVAERPSSSTRGMNCMDKENADDAYLKIIRNALYKCKRYRPMFGKRRKSGYSLEEFQTMYREDLLYSWFGLDSPLMYTAHKAAGGITSVYRQIGTACENLFRHILHDTLGIPLPDCRWVYKVPGTGGKEKSLALDGRIVLDKLTSRKAKKRVQDWMKQAAEEVRLPDRTVATLTGAVFEVRQGYKSKDAKRQNADIDNASNAYANLYLPVCLLLSNQIDSDVAERYVRNQWLLLRGTLGGSTTESCYVFCRKVLGYDLADFFERNSPALKAELAEILETLLK